MQSFTFSALSIVGILFEIIDAGTASAASFVFDTSTDAEEGDEEDADADAERREDEQRRQVRCFLAPLITKGKIGFLNPAFIYSHSFLGLSLQYVFKHLGKL